MKESLSRIAIVDDLEEVFMLFCEFGYWERILRLATKTIKVRNIRLQMVSTRLKL